MKDLSACLPRLPPRRTLLLFYLILLLPNLLRQVLYWVTASATGSTAFIVSFETQALYTSYTPLFGFLEEMLIAVVFTAFWHLSPWLRFFAYGWVMDALFDFLSVGSWILWGATPLEMLGVSVLWHFLLREVLLFYVLAGPFLAYAKVSLTRLSLASTGLGLLILLGVLLR